MNRSEQMKQLLQEVYSSNGPGTGMDERILNDASTVMKQACAASQPPPVLDWRQIMRSPVTRVAAVMAVVLSGLWLYSQSRDSSTPTVLSLLNAATAAENAWFTGEHTVHIVNEIVVHARADGDDLARMLEELEADYSESKRVAFTRLVLVQRWLPLYSLEADGGIRLHKLELADPEAAGVKVTDRIWYDPVTGRYARILTRRDRVLFAHAFDGQQVHLAQIPDGGALTVESNPVTPAFTVPQAPADFLGLTAGIRHMLPEAGGAPLEELEPETAERDDGVSVYKLGFTDPWEKLDTYQLLYVDQQDRSITKIECVVDQKPTLTIERQSVTQAVHPPAGWDLSGLQAQSGPSVEQVTVQADGARVGLSVDEMVKRAGFPVYVFARHPRETVQREIVDVMDPASPPQRLMIVMYDTEVEAFVTLIQCQTVTRYITTSLKNWQKEGVQWRPIYTTARGFKLYDIHALGGIDWVLETIYAQLKVTPAPNQNGYVFETPDGHYVLMGINGWMPGNELEQLADTLIPAETYVSTDQVLPKITPDLNLVTHTDPEHNSFIDRWLLLGRLPLTPTGTDPSEEDTQKRAFDMDQLNVTAIEDQVRIGNRDYAWSACYGDAIDLGRVYGKDMPGICYAQARINVSQETDTVLGIGSDDAVKVWLNGELVHEHWVSRSHRADSDFVPVTLRAGANHLVLKILNGKGPWGFSCRFKEARKALTRTDCIKRPNLTPALEAEIDRFRSQVQWTLESNKVPGAALALVDRQGIVWSEGFGYTTQGGAPVTPDTPFMAVGLTKLVTATAILRAVQAGVLDLDVPLSTYLPNLHLKSRFEENPEDMITLRHLLSHMSGLAQEAPVGNNYEPTGSFAERIGSLKGTWMMQPVGVTYDLGSNVDFDLAAYVLQQVTGQPWEQCLQAYVLDALGMENSVLCNSDALTGKTVAVGVNQSVSRMPVVVPQMGTYGLYSSVTDLARLMQVFLNQGQAAGKPFLKSSLLTDMQRPYNYDTDNWEPQFYYGLGLAIEPQSEQETTLLFFQQSTCYGFSAKLWWSPELGLGMVVLTNLANISCMDVLAHTLSHRLLQQGQVRKRFPMPELDFDQAAGVWFDGDDYAKATPYRPNWSEYCGRYRLKLSGIQLKEWAQRAVEQHPEQSIRMVTVSEKDGFLCITENSHWGMMHDVDTRLDEIQPGVFAHHGYTLDFTGDMPTWKNYRLEKL